MSNEEKIKQPNIIDINYLVGKNFNDINGTKYHIVNLFKDKDIDIITYKTWSKRKQRWYYYSNYLKSFMIQFDYGTIIFNNKIK